MKRVVILFWLTVALGLVLSPAVAIGTSVARGIALKSATLQWIVHLFEPGFNEFLLTLFVAAPFAALAVFLLFHLTAENVPLPQGRLAGVVGSLCAGVALTLSGLIEIRVSRSSTASIGYIFLPFEVLLIMLIGYGAGRRVAKLRPRSTINSSVS